MLLYNILSFVIIFLRASISLNNNDLMIVRKGLEEVHPCSVGLRFYAILNNSGPVDYEVEFTPNECCLITERNKKMDCASLQVFGGSAGTVPKGTYKRIQLVAPLLDPYGRVGFCSVFLDSTIDGQKIIKRDKYTINFDTNVRADEIVQNRTGVRHCKAVDQDPLNFCNPVNCDTYYNGRKPYYNLETKRCTRAPTCIAIDDMKEILIIYNPDSNKCVRNKRIDQTDLQYFKEGLYNKNPFKNILVLKKKNKIQPKKKPLYDCEINDQTPKVNDKKNKTKKVGKTKKILEKTKTKIVSCSWTFWLTIIISIQCCLICAMVYMLTCRIKKWNNAKNNADTYYKYKSDPSITTPLITTTSNLQTNTTEYKYSSPASTLNTKVKHYKPIADHKVGNVKKTVSDDILSKCINRRDWIRKTDPNNVQNNYTTYTERSIQDIIERQNEETQYQANFPRKFKESRVNFENENKKPKKTVTVVSSYQSKTSSSAFNKGRQSECSEESNNSDRMEHMMSEKELKCTSYSYTSKQNLTGFKPSMQKNNFACTETKHIDTDTNRFNSAQKRSNNAIQKTDKETLRRKTTEKPTNLKADSKSDHKLPHIEKSAQAYFSNDSIDDFLSERGMKFLTGDDVSKYTFSTDSTALNESSLSTAMSNKTSKNNIVKRVLSLIHRPKTGPSSDPGTNKDTCHDYDIQVLHMSNASLYSSSNYTMNNKSTDSQTHSESK